MGIPTWHDVQAGRIGTEGFNTAANLIGGGINGMRDSLAVEEARLKERNTALFQQEMRNRYQTPEALMAAQQSGELSALQQGFGEYVNLKQMNEAPDLLRQKLYDNFTKATQYDATKLDLATQPFEDQFNSANIAGDATGMARARAAYLAAGGKRESVLATNADNREQAVKQRGWDNTKHANSLLKFADELKTSENQRKTALGNLAVNQGQLAEMKRNNTFTQLDRINDNLAKATEDAGRIKNSVVLASSTEGIKVIDDIGKDIKDPQVRQAFDRVRAGVLANPNMPLSDALPSITAAMVDNRGWLRNKLGASLGGTSSVIDSVSSRKYDKPTNVPAAGSPQAVALEANLSRMQNLQDMRSSLESQIKLPKPTQTVGTAPQTNGTVGALPTRPLDTSVNAPATQETPEQTTERIKRIAESDKARINGGANSSVYVDTESSTNFDRNFTSISKKANEDATKKALANKLIAEANRIREAEKSKLSSEIEGITEAKVQSADAKESAKLLKKYGEVLPLGVKKTLESNIEYESARFKSRLRY